MGNVDLLGYLLLRDRAVSVLSLLSWSVLKVQQQRLHARHFIPKFGDDLRKVIERNLIFSHLTTRSFSGIVLQRNPVTNRRASHCFITGASRNNHAVEPHFWLLFVDKTRI